MPSVSDKAEYICTEYDKGRSTEDLAQELGTYRNAIIRVLRRAGKRLRSKSDAQAQALKQGRSTHPTKGKHRPADVRERISETRAKRWDEMSDADLQKRRQQAREQWDAMSELQKEQMRHDAAVAVREAAKSGSKLERYLMEELLAHGYPVEFHLERFAANEKLHIDLFLPREKVAIEVDGRAHFDPTIWGQEVVDKHRARDAQKTGLILGLGWTCVRIKHLSRSLSAKSKREALRQVLAHLCSDTARAPRLIEFEV